MTTKKANRSSFYYYIKKYRIAYLFILPTLIGMIIMHLIPIVQGIYMSFLKLDSFTLGQYLAAPLVWHKNYYDILLNPQSPMRIGIFDSIRNTFIYTILVTSGQIAIGMLVALVLNIDFKGRGFVRSLFLFSWIVPTYVTGILWGFMWQQSIGIINTIVYDFFKWHLIAPYINKLIKLLFIDKLLNVLNLLIDLNNLVINFLHNLIPIVPGLVYYYFLVLAFIGISVVIYKKYSKKIGWTFFYVSVFLWFMALINVHIPTAISIAYRPFWLVGPNTIWAIIVPTIWRYWPMSMLMLLAGLQSIPLELYDATKIDGASRWTTFWKVTWPMLQPVWMILILFGMIYNVYSFNIVIMMFGNGAGFPGEWGDLMMTNIFRNSFMRWDFGAGAATSVLLLVIMVFAVNLWFRFYKKSEENI